MDVKNKRQKKSSCQQVSLLNDDYSLTISLSKMKKYGNRNNGVTNSENPIRSDHSYSMSSSQAIQSPYTSDVINRGDYYNLDNKITTLTDNNNQAHENLRKELEQKIENAITKIESKRRWLIGIVVTIVLTIGGFLFVPYKIAKNNEVEIKILKKTICPKEISNENNEKDENRHSVKQENTEPVH